MEIDNIQHILPFISPTSSDDFYFLQILKRKKENPEIGSNSIVIGNYYIKDQEHLLRVYEDVKNIARATNSRVMIQLNKRSFETVAYKTLENIASSMMNKDFTHMSNQYSRAVEQTNADKDKKWIIDIDVRDTNFVEEVTMFINQLEPIGLKELAFLESKSGWHIISKPFNMQKFSERYPNIDVQKNNPTNLFLVK